LFLQTTRLHVTIIELQQNAGAQNKSCTYHSRTGNRVCNLDVQPWRLFVWLYKIQITIYKLKLNWSLSIVKELHDTFWCCSLVKSFPSYVSEALQLTQTIYPCTSKVAYRLCVIVAGSYVIFR
jgi:hypothetical protein